MHLHIGPDAQRDLGDEAGAGHDVEVGVHAPGFQGDGAHCRRVGDDDGQDTGRVDAQMLKDDRLGGVPVRDGLLVLVAAHGLGVHLQDGVGDAGFLGHLGLRVCR